MRLLVDENMPRSLAPRPRALGFAAEHMHDIGLRGQPDTAVYAAALERDAVIVTRDRGFAADKGWPPGFSAGVVFVHLPDDTPASHIIDKVIELLSKRDPGSLLGAVTTLERRRALSRLVRRRR